jgi:hypothetical protein
MWKILIENYLKKFVLIKLNVLNLHHQNNLKQKTILHTLNIIKFTISQHDKSK